MRGVTAFAAILLFSSLVESGSPPQRVVVSGADSMILLAQKTAKSFTFSHPGVQIDVTPGGEARAIQQLTRGVDVAQGVSSTPRSAADRVQLAVGIESSVVVLNKSNTVSELTLNQLKLIFTGKIINWKELGGKEGAIQIYSTESAAGGSLFLRDVLLQDEEFDTTMRGFTNQKEMASAVAADPRGIGFGPITDAASVKLPRISKGKNFVSIEATMDNIRSARYPLARYMYWSIAKNASPLAHQFCEWMVSKDGQLVVESLGYFPLPAEKRQEAMRALTIASPGQ